MRLSTSGELLLYVRKIYAVTYLPGNTAFKAKKLL